MPPNTCFLCWETIFLNIYAYRGGGGGLRVTKRQDRRDIRDNRGMRETRERKERRTLRDNTGKESPD